MKKLNRGGFFGYISMEFYRSRITKKFNIMFYSELEHDFLDDRYECGCCRCCGCMCDWNDLYDE